jgi:elongation factor G
MDYLQEERERGITINAAAISFQWKGYFVNLIDTPGHVDFTMEVERSLRVLDGAVVVLDAVAGVQAQTENVWKQALRYQLPVIVFVNKMDRVGANFYKASKSLSKLEAIPLHLQVPIILNNEFQGLVDLVRMQAITYQDELGKETVSTPWSNWKETIQQYPNDLKQLSEQILEDRKSFLETLAENDDIFMDIYLEYLEKADESMLSEQVIQQAIRRATLQRKLVPVLCGASLRNRGVQCLLDAIVSYLPSPVERPPIVGVNRQGARIERPCSVDGPFLALAFKVTYDLHRGPLVFLRVFSGKKRVRTAIKNVNRQQRETPTNYLLISADDISIQVPEIVAGGVYAAVGLGETASGDTLVDIHDEDALILQGLHIPAPVFYVSVEAESTRHEKALKDALKMLTREDPSLKLEENGGQTLLGGLGELHLDIVKHRLVRDLKVPAIIGPPKVAFRETITESATNNCIYDKHIGGQHLYAEISIQIEPLERGQGNVFSIGDKLKRRLLLESSFKENQLAQILQGSHPKGVSSNKQASRSELSVLEAVIEGFENSLARGVLAAKQVADVHVTLLEMKPFLSLETNAIASLRACAVHAIQETLLLAKPRLLEPIMRVVIQVPSKYVGAVISDLTGNIRRGAVVSLTNEENSFFEKSENVNKVIDARVPLRSLLGYSTDIRTITQGNASFTMDLFGYDFLPNEAEMDILREEGLSFSLQS